MTRTVNGTGHTGVNGTGHRGNAKSLTVTLNLSNLDIMVESSESKVQEQKIGNNARFVRASNEHRET